MDETAVVAPSPAKVAAAALPVGDTTTTTTVCIGVVTPQKGLWSDDSGSDSGASAHADENASASRRNEDAATTAARGGAAKPSSGTCVPTNAAAAAASAASPVDPFFATHTRARAVFAFADPEDNLYLTVAEGEEFFVSEVTEDREWIKATTMDRKQTGWVPFKYVEFAGAVNKAR